MKAGRNDVFNDMKLFILEVLIDIQGEETTIFRVAGTNRPQNSV